MRNGLTKSLSLLLTLLPLACTDSIEPGFQTADRMGGPRVVWNLNAEPLPTIPLPNDVATWPDPTSPTGRRINVSQVAPTEYDSRTRELFGELDGWSTYGPISIPFDAHLDTRDFARRQGGTSSNIYSEAGFTQHAVYVIDLETGLPVPLDVNGGAFPLVLDNPSQYWANDPRAGESNLLFETVREDLNNNGTLDPGEDTDFDGVLDEPNTFDGTRNTDLDTVDQMTWFYERETKTLLVRPLLPLDPAKRYAVVVTKRLRGENGMPVESAFESVHPLPQTEALRPLPGLLSAHPELYGDLAEAGWDGVAFAWSFTTQSTTREVDALRAGLYGDGQFNWLERTFPPDYALAPMVGGRGCPTEGRNTLVASGDDFRNALSTLAPVAFQLTPSQTQSMLDSYSNLDHLVVMFFDTPYYLGDPKTSSVEDTFQINASTGTGRVGRETISMILFVPKETETNRQPFHTSFYAHGYGSAAIDSLVFAGHMIKNGVAFATLNAEGHSASVAPGLITLLQSLFESSCLKPAAAALLEGRGEDQNRDGTPDSGVDFWTSYVFHTRDVLRQTALDYSRAIRIFRSFDGRTANPVSFVDGVGDMPLAYDGQSFGREGGDIAGDFDGNGEPDVGGPDGVFSMIGGSLGGIVTNLTAGIEPTIQNIAPIVGAGGLTDVASRIDMGSVNAAMIMRIMGPFIIVEPRTARGNDQSGCPMDELSVYWLATDRNSRGQPEVACIPRSAVSADGVMRVRNLRSGEVRCGGAVRGEADRFRVGIATDIGDEVEVSFFNSGAATVSYPECPELDGVTPSRVVTTIEQNPMACRDCAKWQGTNWEVGAPLRAPAVGFARARQTPNLRRLLALAQTGLDAADPINYAARMFIKPYSTLDAPIARSRNVLVLNSTGDQSVAVNTGNAFARAAGVLPFVPPDGPDHLADWRAPSWFAARYPGMNYRTPQEMLVGYHVLEGVERLARHPGEGRPANFLVDIDNLSEGLATYTPDGNAQSSNPSDPKPLTPPRPLRWARQSVASASSPYDVWNPVPGTATSGLLNYYCIPNGVHGFDSAFLPDDQFGVGPYILTLASRWISTMSRDLRYRSDPNGHHCLENGTCSFFE